MVNKLIEHNGGEWVMGCVRPAKLGEIGEIPGMRFVVVREATLAEADADC